MNREICSKSFNELANTGFCFRCASQLSQIKSNQVKEVVQLCNPSTGNPSTGNPPTIVIHQQCNPSTGNPSAGNPLTIVIHQQCNSSTLGGFPVDGFPVDELHC